MAAGVSAARTLLAEKRAAKAKAAKTPASKTAKKAAKKATRKAAKKAPAKAATKRKPAKKAAPKKATKKPAKRPTKKTPSPPARPASQRSTAMAVKSASAFLAEIKKTTPDESGIAAQAVEYIKALNDPNLTAEERVAGLAAIDDKYKPYMPKHFVKEGDGWKALGPNSPASTDPGTPVATPTDGTIVTEGDWRTVQEGNSFRIEKKAGDSFINTMESFADERERGKMLLKHGTLTAACEAKVNPPKKVFGISLKKS